MVGWKEKNATFILEELLLFKLVEYDDLYICISLSLLRSFYTCEIFNHGGVRGWMRLKSFFRPVYNF